MKAGWEEVTVKDLCTIRTGRKDVNQGNPSGKYPFFTCAKMHTYSDEWSFDGEALLIAGNGDVGNLSYCNGKFEAYQRTYVLMDFRRVLPHFLYYVFDAGLKPMLFGQKLGNTMPYIKKGMITDFPVPLPPIEEQHRIVAVLDEASEGLARARAHAEANLQNARDLFDEVVNACFARANAQGGAATRLGLLAEFRNGLNFTRTSSGRSVKIVGVGDFKDHFTVPVDTLSEITIDGELAGSDQLHPGDIVAVRSNGNRELIGRTMLVPSLAEQVSFSGFTIRIRLTTDKLLPEYLCEYMRTKKARRILIDGGGGSNISNLNQGLLSNLPINFPDLATQRDTLDELDLARSQSVELVQHYRKKLQSLDTLRQSLLQKAFAGELT